MLITSYSNEIKYNLNIVNLYEMLILNINFILFSFILNTFIFIP